MPIKVTSRTLTPNDPFAKPTEARTPGDDAILSRWIAPAFSCYVLLGPESTKVGVGSHLAPSSHVVVLHCDETMRSSVVLVGSIGRLGFLQTFDIHLSYITQGALNPLIYALILHDGVSTPFVLDSLTSSLRASAERLGHRIEVTALEGPSQACAVLFKRATATLEWLLKSPCTDLNEADWPELDVEDSFPTVWSAFKLLQTKLDFLVGVFPVLPCHYDGKAYADRLPIFSDDARAVLVAVRMELGKAGKRGQTPVEYFETTNLDAPLSGVPSGNLAANLRKLLMPVADLGPLCSVCANLGVPSDAQVVDWGTTAP